MSAGTSMYLKEKLLPLITHDNNCAAIHVLDSNYTQWIYTFPPPLTPQLLSPLHNSVLSFYSCEFSGLVTCFAYFRLMLIWMTEVI